MDELAMQYEKAVKEYQQAMQDFDEADFEFIDVAIIKLQYTEQRLSLLLSEFKKQMRKEMHHV